jgi:hypothetical protein
MKREIDLLEKVIRDKYNATNIGAVSSKRCDFAKYVGVYKNKVVWDKYCVYNKDSYINTEILFTSRIQYDFFLFKSPMIIDFLKKQKDLKGVFPTANLRFNQVVSNE